MKILTKPLNNVKFYADPDWDRILEDADYFLDRRTNHVEIEDVCHV